MQESEENFVLINKKTDKIALEHFGFDLNEIKVENILQNNEE